MNKSRRRVMFIIPNMSHQYYADYVCDKIDQLYKLEYLHTYLAKEVHTWDTNFKHQNFIAYLGKLQVVKNSIQTSKNHGSKQPIFCCKKQHSHAVKNSIQTSKKMCPNIPFSAVKTAHNPLKPMSKQPNFCYPNIILKL